MARPWANAEYPASRLKKGDWLRASGAFFDVRRGREVPSPLFQRAARVGFVWMMPTLLWLSTSVSLAGQPVQLTRDGTQKFAPTFTSRDGAKLVYVLYEKPTQWRLMRLKMSDLSVRPVHENASNSEFGPAFSSDGRYFAYVHNRATLSMALIIRDTKEDKQTEVPPAPGFAGMVCPTISPDATRVLYSFAEGGRQDIFSVDMQAGDRKNLTNHPSYNNWPSFSPDGKQIAFGSTRDGNFEIYVMNADGSNVRRLTNHPLRDIRPRFSPDGKRIAFTSMRDGNFEIYVMNADGSGKTRMTDHPEIDDFACWHPDGTKLVTVSQRSGRYDLYLIEVPESGGD